MYRMRLWAAAVALLLCVAAQAESPAAVVNPEVPESITFAGQRFDLSGDDARERLDRELTAMAFTHGNTLLQLKRQGRWFPVLQPALQKAGMHPDWIYLACVESTLDPLAQSGAGAAGLWQMMPTTGKEYGLEVNDEVDERYHPVKSTQAAARYIQRSLDMYGGDVASVAAAYNTGMARVTREREAQGTDDGTALWLSQQTMRYIYRLLAAKLIMEHPERYGYHLEPGQRYKERRTREVTVSTPVDDWAAWARDNGATYYELRELNPWIRAKKLTNKAGRTYTVLLPQRQ